MMSTITCWCATLSLRILLGGLNLSKVHDQLCQSTPENLETKFGLQRKEDSLGTAVMIFCGP